MEKFIRFLNEDLSNYVFENEDDCEEPVVLTSHMGEKILFDFLDLVDYMGSEYAVLYPPANNDGEVVILKLDSSDDNKEIFSSVDDSSLLEAVYSVFKETNADMYNFNDGSASSDYSESTYVPERTGKRKYRSRLALVLMSGFFGWWGAHLKWLGYNEEARAFKEQSGGLFGMFNLSSCFFVWGDYMAIIFGKYREDAYGNPVRYFSHLRNLLSKKK